VRNDDIAELDARLWPGAGAAAQPPTGSPGHSREAWLTRRREAASPSGHGVYARLSRWPEDAVSGVHLGELAERALERIIVDGKDLEPRS